MNMKTYQLTDEQAEIIMQGVVFAIQQRADILNEIKKQFKEQNEKAHADNISARG